MRVLVIGQGGREHALCHKISKSPLCEKLYCAPGNGGTAQIAENISIQAEDIPALVHFAKQNRIDITVVGPEVPLALGIVAGEQQGVYQGLFDEISYTYGKVCIRHNL